MLIKTVLSGDPPSLCTIIFVITHYAISRFRDTTQQADFTSESMKRVQIYSANICKIFLHIHKYNDIGEIYYLIQLRLLYKFRYALSKIRDFSISQMLLVWWWTNFHTIIMRFFSTGIIGFESFGAIFMSKNQWFLQGLQKKAFLVLIPLRFLNCE